VLKNAIDWLSRPLSGKVLVGKPVAVVGASGGRWGTRLAQAAVRQALFATESLLVTAPALYLAQTDAPFDSSGRPPDPAGPGADHAHPGLTQFSSIFFRLSRPPR